MIHKIFDNIAGAIAIVLVLAAGLVGIAVLAITGVTALVAFACLSVVKYFTLFVAFLVSKIIQWIKAAYNKTKSFVSRMFKRNNTVSATDENGNVIECELLEAVPAPVVM